MKSALFVLTSILPLQLASAQTTGTLRGQVTDPSAAVVPGATVQVTGNGISRSAKTDGQGRYTITAPAGTYAVQADATGFVTFTRPEVDVAAGQVSPLDIGLQIAVTEQQVQVSDSGGGPGYRPTRRRMPGRWC